MHILYTNIDLKLPNKLHGPMHYKKGVTCVFDGHMFIRVIITPQCYPLFHNSADLVMNSRASGQCSHAICMYSNHGCLPMYKMATRRYMSITSRCV